MISLDVQPYCHGCVEFEPVCEKLIVMNIDGEKEAIEQIVQCRYEGRCKKIHDRIKAIERGR